MKARDPVLEERAEKEVAGAEEERLVARPARVFVAGSMKALRDGLRAGGTLVMTAPQSARPEEEEEG